ncbi:Uncharacterised protein [Klebsiella pneumoniae]|nr:Uncharacterised protein [Klebsiella pneumoniae]
MPAGLLVDFCAQTQRAGSGVSSRIRLQHRVKVDEIRPDQHPFSLTEIFAVGNRFFHGFTTVGRQVRKAAQALRHA